MGNSIQLLIKKKYSTLEESVRIIKSQRSDIERNKLIKIVKDWILMKLFFKKTLQNLKQKHIIDIL